MDDELRYRYVLAECLQHEPKAQRDAVLDRYPAPVQDMVRRMMAGLAQRLAARIRARQSRDRRHLSNEECDRLYRERIDEIRPAWLAERVDTMLREQAQRLKHQRRQLQETLL